ncbi:MAG: hypothetical protein QE278_13125 [Limnobacter sp.]|nr:hypothetical protein [Limnobacter sp.]
MKNTLFLIIFLCLNLISLLLSNKFELDYSGISTLAHAVFVIGSAAVISSLFIPQRIDYLKLLLIGFGLEILVWLMSLESLYFGLPDTLYEWVPLAFARAIFTLVLFGLGHGLLALIQKVRRQSI